MFVYLIVDTSAINQWDAKYTNLIDELTKGKDDLPAKPDYLKAYPSNLTQELKVLRNQHDTVVASLDKLQKELNRLNLNRTGRKSKEKQQVL